MKSAKQARDISVDNHFGPPPKSLYHLHCIISYRSVFGCSNFVTFGYLSKRADFRLCIRRHGLHMINIMLCLCQESNENVRHF